jgi:hypothetical protein
MTTDAFSLNFSFEDEKNASTPPSAVPNSPKETDSDSFLVQEETNPEVIESNTPSFDNESGDNSFDFDSLELESQLQEVKSEETDLGDVDASDPFAGYSFDFGAGDTSLDDLPSEINVEGNQFDLDEDKKGVLFSEEQNPEPELAVTSLDSTFPETEDFLVTSQTESEEVADEEQSFFLESPE